MTTAPDNSASRAAPASRDAAAAAPRADTPESAGGVAAAAGVPGAWRALTAAALLGVERAAPPAVAPALPRAPGAAGETTPERAVLLQAATLAPLLRAGRGFGTPAAAPPPAAAPCPPESLPPVGAAASARLAGMLAAGLSSALARNYLNTWLDAAVAAGQRVPFTLLPELLDFAARSDASQHVSAQLLRVIGARGYWLAAQNPAWQRVTDAALLQLSPDAPRTVDLGDDAVTRRMWETGTATQRSYLLRMLRRRDAERGRLLLLSSWAAEDHSTRARLLPEIAAGLSSDDAAFLDDVAERDRSELVRGSAEQLLRALSDSRYAARLRQQRPHLEALARATVRVEMPPYVPLYFCVEPPELYNESLRSAGIAEKGWSRSALPDSEKLRARWVEQLFSLVALPFWTSACGAECSPAAFADALQSDPWAVSALSGLRLAVMDGIGGDAVGSFAWARALLSRRADLKLAALLPYEERRALTSEALDFIAAAPPLPPARSALIDRWEGVYSGVLGRDPVLAEKAVQLLQRASDAMRADDAGTLAAGVTEPLRRVRWAHLPVPAILGMLLPPNMADRLPPLADADADAGADAGASPGFRAELHPALKSIVDDLRTRADIVREINTP